MASDFKEIFGDFLGPPIFQQQPATFPSPEELKYKILLKGKLCLTDGKEDDEREQDVSTVLLDTGKFIYAVENIADNDMDSALEASTI